MAAFAFGYLTINNKKVAGLEEVSLEASREEDEVWETDNVEVSEYVPTRIKYKMGVKIAYSDSTMFKAMQQGIRMNAILFRKDLATGKITAVRDCRGVQIIKNNLGPLTGNKHVVEDLDFSVARVIPLD